MTSELTQLGSAGLLAYLLVKEMLAFASKHKNGKNGSSGQQAPSYWILEFQRAVEQGNKPVIERLDSLQRDIRDMLRRPQ